MALKLDKTIFMVHVIKTDGEESKLFFRDYTVSNDAFKDDITLKEVEIHADAKKICDGAFEGCTSLTTVKLPESIDIIRRFAFYGCTALETIVLPETLTRVDCWDYHGVSKLTLHFPNPQAQKRSSNSSLAVMEKHGFTTMAKNQTIGIRRISKTND